MTPDALAVNGKRPSSQSPFGGFLLLGLDKDNFVIHNSAINSTRPTEMTLIHMQEKCLARMQETRTSPKREAKNRGAATNAMYRQMLAKGYTEAEAKQAVADVRDMFLLNSLAEE